MLVEEYKEVTEPTWYEFNQKQDDVTYTKDNDILTNSIDMLKMWGFFSRYKSGCGYKALSLYRSINPSNNRDMLLIENDIEFIESALLKLKNSKLKKDNQRYLIAEAYYKGIDIAIDGYDCSQKLTQREIAEYLDIPKSTVNDRLREVESYIISELSKINSNNFI